VQKTLKVLAPDQIQTEQYMDFIRNRMFRETLLVPEKTVPNWTIQPDSVRTLHVASSGRPAEKGEVDIKSDVTVQFQTRTGMALATNRPLLKAAMAVLMNRWPGTIPFDELLAEARGLLGLPAESAEEDAKMLALGLVNTYISSDLLELHAAPVAVSRVIPAKPTAIASARERVKLGATAVANRRHELVKLTDLDLRLLPLLDGTRDRPVLLDRLTEKALAGDLQVQKGGQRLTDPAGVKSALAVVMDQALAHLAAQALLVS
jgi:methyltransferase-like protein